MLNKKEIRIVKKILENPLSRLVESGSNNDLINSMIERGLIGKEYHFTNKNGEVYYKYTLSKISIEAIENEY